MKIIISALTFLVFFTNAFAIDRESLLREVSTFDEVERTNFFNNTELGATNEAYFRVFIERRLSQVSPEEQIFLKSILNSAEIIVDEKFEIPFLQIDFSGKITGYIPEWFLNSLLYYKALVHELEHGLQVFRAKKLEKDFRQLERTLLGDGELIFVMEKNAMSMEWLFLHSSPRSLQENVLAMLNELNTPMQDVTNIFEYSFIRHKSMGQNSKTILIRMLEGARHDIDYYLNNEWDYERHDLKSSMTKAEENMGKFIILDWRERLKPLNELFRLQPQQAEGWQNKICSDLFSKKIFSRMPIMTANKF